MEEMKQLSPEDQKLIDDLAEERKKKGISALEMLLGIKWENVPKFDVRCKNCGRSVYVGKCCDNPDIEIKE